MVSQLWPRGQFTITQHTGDDKVPLNCHSPMAALQRVTVRNWRPRRTVDLKGLPLLLPDAIFIRVTLQSRLAFLKHRGKENKSL